MICQSTIPLSALDAIIIASILLFILSTITEKVTDLVRMYPSQFRILGFFYGLFFYFQIINGIYNEPILGKLLASFLFLFNTFLLIVIWANTEVLADKSSKLKKILSKNLSIFNNVNKRNNVSELKEREVTALSFMIGLIVCFLFGANLFSLFNIAVSPSLKPKSPFAQNPIYALDPDFFKLNIIDLIGFCLTAFFLAFGAKFFHDLLDNLLQIKNLKRKLNDAADSEFTNIAEVDEFLKDNEQKRLRELIESEFEKINGAKQYFTLDIDKQQVTIHTYGDVTNAPSVIPFKSSTGKVKLIKVNIEKHLNQISALGVLNPGDELANENDLNDNAGSLGYSVTDIETGQKLILTCYHVVWNPTLNWGLLDLRRGNLNVVHPVNGIKVGRIKHAIKNSSFDVALIQPIPGTTISNKISFLGIPKSVIAVDKSMIGFTVTMISRRNPTKAMRGRIIDINVQVDNIKYPGGNTFSLRNLICIRPFESPFSIGGDSGSLVLDDFGNAIGLLVAGDKQDASFAIPLQNIFNFYNLKI